MLFVHGANQQNDNNKMYMKTSRHLCEKCSVAELLDEGINVRGLTGKGGVGHLAEKRATRAGTGKIKSQHQN